jgi:hypothetical protein
MKFTKEEIENLTKQQQKAEANKTQEAPATEEVVENEESNEN